MLEQLAGSEKIQGLGSGTFGVVASARHSGSGRAVAIKLCQTMSDSTSFQRELHVIKKMSLPKSSSSVCLMFAFHVWRISKSNPTLLRQGHPAFLPVYDHAQEHSLLKWFAMPAITPGSADRFIKLNGHLDADRLAAFGRQLVDALNFMHSHAIVHLDVKPKNILWRDQDRHLFLIDFGTSIDVPLRHPMSGKLCYTCQYRAVELWTSNDVSKLLGPATESWAAGCSLYEVGVGERLFPCSSLAELQAEIAQYKWLRSVAENAVGLAGRYRWSLLPADWRALIWKLLCPEPCHRLLMRNCVRNLTDYSVL